MPRALPAEFRSDRTARARHHDGAPAQPAPDEFPVRRHRFATQQVFDRDLLEVARHGLPFQHVDQSGHHAERQACALADRHHALHGGRVQRGHGDDEHPRRGFTGDGGGALQSTQHGNTLQLGAMQTHCIIEEGNRMVDAGAAQLANQGFACTPCAKDQYARGRFIDALRLAVLPCTIDQTRQSEETDQCERIEAEHDARRGAEAVIEEQTQHHTQEPEGASLHNVPEIRQAGEAPQTAVEPHPPEHHTLRQQDDGDLVGPQGKLRGGRQHGVAQPVQDLPADPHHGQIVGRDEDAWHETAQSIPPGFHQLHLQVPVLATPSSAQ